MTVNRDTWCFKIPTDDVFSSAKTTSIALKMLSLLSFWILAGVMQEGSAMTHYQLKNSSLCLHVKEPEPYKGGEWSFAAKVIASDDINPNYTEKVVYNPVTLSLCLKELTDKDTGDYVVRFKDSKFNVVFQRHTVIVQDSVPRPVIIMSVQHSNLSTESCSIIVNCSIQDEWVLSVCDNDSCRASQESFSKVNITVFADNRTVFCTGKNHVSTNCVSESMTTVCFSKSIADDKETSQSFFLIVIFFAVFVCLFVAFMAYRVKWLCLECNHHQRPTSEVELVQTQPIEAQPQPEPRGSTSSSSEAEANYENMDTMQPRQTSSPREEMVPMPQVDTVYSTLQVPNVTPSLGEGGSSKNVKGYKMTQEPSSSSQTVSVEAEHLTQIDTVYSVLQKPNNLKSQLHQQVKQDFSKQ